MKNIISSITIFSIFLFLSCSCGQKQPGLEIQEIAEKESVVPKVKKSSEQLKSIAQEANLGGEQILKLQIRTTNAILLAKKQESKELQQKLQLIGDELELLRKWNRNQSSDLRSLENTLTDVEIALNIKEGETRRLRESNKELRKQTVKAQEDVINVKKKILEVEAESGVKIATMEKKIDGLKKYRNICFGVGGLLALGIGFKLFGPRIF
jgi:hypothetical protein